VLRVPMEGYRKGLENCVQEGGFPMLSGPAPSFSFVLVRHVEILRQPSVQLSSVL
jgi:hypothetical protein